VKTLGFLTRLSKEESWTIGQQVRGSAPSVCACLAEAWRKRRYKKSFISKLTDAEGEAAETQVWLEIMWRQGRITESEFTETFNEYEKVIGQIISFQNTADKFAIFTSMESMLLLLAAFVLALTAI
jgi:four helix bundle protein